MRTVKRISYMALAVLLLVSGVMFPSAKAESAACDRDKLASNNIPLDSWIYPAVWRLYALGYVDDSYLGIRPWTRNNLRSFLKVAEERITDKSARANRDQAEAIYDSLKQELRRDGDELCPVDGEARVESVYTTNRGITGTPLVDSFHLGETIINNYGRPVAEGWNNQTGISGSANWKRFTFYVRDEYQHAPAMMGYDDTLTATLLDRDGMTFYLNTTKPIPYKDVKTIPYGSIGEKNQDRFVEIYVATRLLNHQISFGKQDSWYGPAMGGGMAMSNNSENFYTLHITRTEPLYVPGLSRITGPFQYEFVGGPLRGHMYPKNPWMHYQKLSFKPTENLEFGFQRSVIWGGKDHEPINLHSFLRSFFSVLNTDWATKNSRSDPGARFAAFDASYRLPFVRNWATFYIDSEVHDDISPADAPRRASIRPGLYLTHLPGLPKLDLRGEAAMTDPSVSTSNGGRFMYFEAIQRQGYTNQGQMMGDWMGREAKGGQVWATWHLSGNEWIQINWRGQKAAKDFIKYGTTINDFGLQTVKRIGRNFEINGNFTLERWQAPIYKSGLQTVTNTSVQLTWYPDVKAKF